MLSIRSSYIIVELRDLINYKANVRQQQCEIGQALIICPSPTDASPNRPRVGMSDDVASSNVADPAVVTS